VQEPYILGLTLTPTTARGMLDAMAPPSDPTKSSVVGSLLLTLGTAIAAPALSPTEVLEAAVSVLDATSPRGPSASHHGAHTLHLTGSRAVAVSSGAGIDLGSAAPSGTNIYFYVAVPVTEVGTYVSDQIVDDMKATAELVQTWVPPTVRAARLRT
jgi:hypothetical protein